MSRPTREQYRLRTGTERSDVALLRLVLHFIMKTQRKTIKRSKLSNLSMVASGEKSISKVIIDGTVKQWAGVGWVNEGKPTKHQTETLPHVVD